MLQDPSITVDTLSKTFKLYADRRDRIKELIHPFGKQYHTKFHALKDISFSVKKGEIVGIIGTNGSGKSTLLKILSSVVIPTSGNFKIDGRITAILELGGGFNSELTGIENIYFMGGLQGITRKEMQHRVQMILDFAEIHEYADQPIKSYSSGMYLRLAFSMAININPEILLIDEVLAVGDARFQNKCFRKIREFKEAGKTIVFCSHNLSAVKDFCTYAFWLHRGEISREGYPHIVVEAYKEFSSQNSIQLTKK